MKSCAKVKNPCKICLQSVTNKTGVQCKGACKKWAHFTCLEYTPGKIQDIKAGILTITCPCPNCNTQEPKEFLTKPSYTCNNQECPANKIPKCQQNECPLNNPVSRGVSPTQMAPPVIPLGPPPCGPACATSQTSRFTPPTSSPEMTRIPAVTSQPEEQRESSPPPCEPIEVPPCFSIPVVIGQVDSKSSPPRVAKSPQKVPSPIRTSRDVYVENKPVPPQLKSASCSCMTWPGDTKKTIQMVNVSNQGSIHFDGNKTGDSKETCSDSKLNKGNSRKVLCCTIQELCSTVGHLSSQIQDLMCKMMNSRDDE